MSALNSQLRQLLAQKTEIKEHMDALNGEATPVEQKQLAEKTKALVDNLNAELGRDISSHCFSKPNAPMSFSGAPAFKTLSQANVTLTKVRDTSAPVSDRINSIQDFERVAKINTSWWRTAGRVAAAFIGAAVGAAVGCVVGAIIGAPSGPGAAVTAALGALAGGKAGVTAGLAIGGAVATGCSLFGLFQTRNENASEDFSLAAQRVQVH